MGICVVISGILMWSGLLVFGAVTFSHAQGDVAVSQVFVVVGERACETELKVADVLAERLAKRSGMRATVVPEGKAESSRADLVVFLGLPANHSRLAALCAENGMALPTERDPGPEGFAVKTVSTPDGPAILAAGVDKRGVLYASGEILRQVTYNQASISVPAMDLRTAPAFRWRGSSANQGGTMMSMTGARRWSTEELHEYALDLALSGANVFYASGEFGQWLKSFDLMTEAGFRPNEWKSQAPYPSEWQATERGNWVCPSIPEARAALLAQWEGIFKAHEGADVMRLFAGDPGGCRCSKCTPWGRTFIHLCEDVAKIWLKYHPDSKVLIANQDLDNAGDIAIFDYLNEKPQEWLYAICYGPGSNAMSPYFRGELREDLFIYRGNGPLNRYLREILNRLPKQQKIVHYSDITHWISSQYQVDNPDPYLVAVYGRRMFHVRPRAYYRVFQSIMPFAEGDIIYSEGYHDEFHQYMWNRLLWNPNRALEDIMMEYARLYFGPDAAPDMVQAMLQLEQNLEASLATNEGIDRYYLLVRAAGWKIPPHLMRDNHRWRLHMQKAALDKYVQLKLRGELDQQERVMRVIEQALAARDARLGLTAADILNEPVETPEMAALRAEAGRLGQESDAIFGVRDVGYFRLDQAMVGLAWVRRGLDEAKSGPAEEQLRRLEQIVRYEDPGPGGFYDSAQKARHPHLVKGETYDASQWMDPVNRPSQSVVAYSFDDGKGVVFRYTGLDPAASYRVRLTMVAPRMPQSGARRSQVRLAQHVVADGEYLARDVEIPAYTARQFEYDIPQTATRDGTLELWLEKAVDGMAAVVSEVWVLKKP